MPEKIAQRNVQLRRIEFHPHQEGVGIVIAVLVSVKNVAAVLRNKSRDSSNDAFAVRAAEEKDGRFLHFMNHVTQALYLRIPVVEKPTLTSHKRRR